MSFEIIRVALFESTIVNSVLSFVVRPVALQDYLIYVFSPFDHLEPIPEPLSWLPKHRSTPEALRIGDCFRKWNKQVLNKLIRGQSPSPCACKSVRTEGGSIGGLEATKPFSPPFRLSPNRPFCLRKRYSSISTFSASALLVHGLHAIFTLLLLVSRLEKEL
ncbi:hypothetical protein L596_001936 [Steinernema carpocapsae]|uniref:Uncharacterized protein n=1 Tax=Steinernema carpocapsae TaxID=34508 RepID=A0A4U8UN68_STECR|nr:hypothetical protein L596_001936 [Steinernema carpocapsae]